MYKPVDPQPGSGNHKAGPTQIWVCGACGKKSRWKYGFTDDGKDYIYVNESGITHADPGWDESCMMSAVLCEVVED